MVDVAILDDEGHGSTLEVRWPSSPSRSARYSAYWLRLYSQRKTRYIGVADRWTDGANFAQAPGRSSTDERITAASVEDGTSLRVTFGDGRSVVYPLGWLRAEGPCADAVDEIEPVAWDAGSSFTAVAYDDLIQDDAVLADFLKQFLAYGLGFVYDAGTSPATVRRAADRLGTLERSHLGDTFSIGVRATSRHIGETADAIPLHTDMVYKQVPPRLQLLHALSQAAIGGENVLVDGVTASRSLPPRDVELLRETEVWFVGSSETVHFRGRHRILNFDRHGRFSAVYYNDDKLVFPADLTAEFFAAYRRFEATAARPDLKRTMQLAPGSMVLLDNRRVLHGRRRFEGDRRVEGCYVSDDDLRSTYRALVRASSPLPYAG